MADFYTSGKHDKLDFKQIALSHYKRILELSCSEFCGGYWNYVFIGNTTNKIYVTDKRKEFIQAIELLALALYPHFDKDMKEEYKDYKGKIEKLKEEDNLKHSKKNLKLAKTLFRDLSSLMKRLDYFKTSIYGEGNIGDIDGNR